MSAAKLVGVVAEYDPLHHGHAYQLKAARERSGADYVVAVMSTVFTQRGDAAILPPAVRVRAALEAGADAVLALPVLWAVRDAEHFALGAIRILQGVGCTALSFGCETADEALLRRTALALEMPSPAMLACIHGRLDAGASYPSAVAAAMELLMPEGAQLLNCPNNLLAVSYLRAMHWLGRDMEIVPVQRRGDYHATMVETMPSASAVRGAMLRGDWNSVERSMPPAAWREVRQAVLDGKLHRPEALDPVLLYRLRILTNEEWESLPDLSEGIENRLKHAATETNTRQELLQRAKTRRYPYTRLSRLATHALLGMTDVLLSEETLPQAAWLLGFRKESAPVLREMEQGGLPLITKASRLPENDPTWELERSAWDLWALGVGTRPGLMYTQGMQIIE